MMQPVDPLFMVEPIHFEYAAPVAAAGASLIWYLLKRNQEDIPRLLEKTLEAVNASTAAIERNAEAAKELQASVQEVVRAVAALAARESQARRTDEKAG